MKNSNLPPRKTAEEIALRVVNRKPVVISPWEVFWICFFAGIGLLYLVHACGAF